MSKAKSLAEVAREGRHSRAARVKSSTRKRLGLPMILPGNRFHEFVQLTPKDFDNIEIDRRYQRPEQTTEIYSIAAALDAGGVIVDPITLAKRKFKDDGTVAGRYYVVDGQQRFLACMLLDRPCPAVVWETHSLEEEMTMFNILNTSVNQHPNNRVFSWPGPIGQMLRRVAEDPGNPLYQLVAFNNSAGRPLKRAVFSASVLVRGVLACLTRTHASGRVDTFLQRVDVELAKGAVSNDRAEKYLRLVPLVFVPGQTFMRSLPAIALGLVAGAKWMDSGKMPTPQSCKRIGTINWDKLCPTNTGQFLLVLTREIDRKWKT
ncbi:MAG: ParB N-terminal domain-containing protein [Candidatus Methylomirabilis sp.]